jgi:hypothetical protein
MFPAADPWFIRKSVTTGTPVSFAERNLLMVELLGKNTP